MNTWHGFSRGAQIGLIGGSFVVLALFVLLTTGVSLNNRATALEIQAANQQDVNKTVKAKMHDIIFGQAGVASAYADKFEQVYAGLMEGRYRTGGEMMKFVQEANPQLDASLYKKVSQSIEEQVTTFQESQKTLISIRQEHATLVKTFPGTLFLSSRKPIEIRLVTNTSTERAFQTGKDDTDPNPFAKPAPQ